MRSHEFYEPLVESMVREIFCCIKSMRGRNYYCNQKMKKFF
ncbi:hypothetical protein BN938_1575 [Mucinivorans hirudinis]|uniref:Uncharacterized protein n=1 Tax=Mucinivorans hirudinis TaxID=1433126 RepID=A0A060R8C3_9BACT|nr:hypothetical protein BN938_1575 [Mucinivorans hirudinis]